MPRPPRRPAAPPSAPRKRRRWVGPAVAAALVAGAAVAAVRLAADPFALPPVSASPLLNTRLGVAYVGSASCAGCHPDRAESFRRTGMGRSMAEVDPAAEPPDGRFDHPLSGRRYEVARDGGRLWHRESPLSGSGAVTQYPAKYAVGSGEHAKTYLAEAEGFLVQSPATWYAGRKQWGLAPGYDRPDHQGFERGVGELCLYCHAGRAEAEGGSPQKVRVHEAAISCERCHGPGQLHAEKHAANPSTPSAEPDNTIAHPGRMSRELAEAVCGQCHLHSAAMVPVRGRAISDFRPGLPLAEFRHEFRREAPGAGMTVVGHVEQMQASRCYTQSTTLTCTTCHDPHGFPKPEERPAHYRAVCQTCHQPEACRVSPAVLRAESPDNDCAKCHMPAAPTEVPHVAFTHHRIGIHKPGAATARPSGPATPVPWGDAVPFGEHDRRRALGLAYAELAVTDPAHAAAYKAKALPILAEVAAALPDPAVDAKLARLLFEGNRPDARAVAERALADPTVSPGDRCAALFVASAEKLRAGRKADALAGFRQLTLLRRHPHDWLLVGECEQALGRPAEAAAARDAARRINPRIPPGP